MEWHEVRFEKEERKDREINYLTKRILRKIGFDKLPDDIKNE